MYFLHFIHIFFRVHFFILNFFTCLAFFRHTAGYCWAYNTRTFFQFYYPKFDIGLWTFCASVFGGSFGVFAGGFFSDRFTPYLILSYLIIIPCRLVNHLGVHSRLWLLFVCTLLAAPLAVGTLHFPPPGAFGEICQLTILLRPESIGVHYVHCDCL